MPLELSSTQTWELWALAQNEGLRKYHPLVWRRVLVALLLIKNLKTGEMLVILTRSGARLSHQGFIDIRAELTRGGVTALITKATKLASEFEISFKNFVDPLRPGNEATIEVVSLVVAESVQIAVLGFCRGGSKRSEFRWWGHPMSKAALEELIERARMNNPRAETPSWRRYFDSVQMELFHELKTRYMHAKRYRWRLDPDQSIEPVPERFRTGWDFLVIKAGDPAVVGPILTQMVGDQGYPTLEVPTASFTSTFEAIVYDLVVRCNLRGLFPSAGNLLQYLQEKQTIVSWHLERRTLLDALRKRIARSLFFACHGYITDLTPTLLKELPYCSSAPLGVWPLRPNVNYEKRGVSPKTSVQPVLGFSIPLQVPASMKPAKFAQRTREALKSHGRYNTRFSYEVRIPGKLPIKPLAFEMGGKPGAIPSEIKPVSVICLPRHYAFPDPPISLQALALLGRETKNGTLGLLERRKIPIDGIKEEVLVFNCPAIGAAIREAFEEDRYGGALSSFKFWELDVKREDIIKWVEPVTLKIPAPFCFSTAAQIKKAKTSNDIERKATATSSPIPYSKEATFSDLLTNFDADFLLRCLTGQSWKGIRAHEKRAEHAVDTFNREIFQRQTDLAQLRSLLRENARGMLKDSKIDLEHLLSIALSESAFPRLVRAAIENAQRLVVGGHSPTYIALLTRSQLWNAGRQFLHAKLSGKVVDEFRELQKRRRSAKDPKTAPKKQATKESISDQAEGKLFLDSTGKLRKKWTPKLRNLARNYGFDIEEGSTLAQFIDFLREKSAPPTEQKKVDNTAENTSDV